MKLDRASRSPFALEKEWVEQHLSEAVPGVREVWVKTVVGRRVIGFAQDCGNREPEQFDASVMSDGTLRSLGILLALRQTPRPSIVLLDEIEDSLHPLAHGVLLDAIDEVSDEFPIVVSTHSPEILEHPVARAERVRVVQRHRWDKSNLRLERECSGEFEAPPDGRPIAPLQCSLDRGRTLDDRNRGRVFQTLMGSWRNRPRWQGHALSRG